jgi:hypothetical protein
MLCFGTNRSSDEEDAVCYLVDEKNTEEGGSKKTCWVYPYCNRSGERGGFIAAKEMDWEGRIVHHTVQEHRKVFSVALP